MAKMLSQMSGLSSMNRNAKTPEELCYKNWLRLAKRHAKVSIRSTLYHP